MKRLILLVGLTLALVVRAAPTPIATVAANITTWVDTTPGAFQWCYYLTAYDADNLVSAPSNVKCATPVQTAPPYTLTVSWIAPTQRTDGAALTNLAGFHIWRVPPSLAAPVKLGQPIILN